MLYCKYYIIISVICQENKRTKYIPTPVGGFSFSMKQWVKNRQRAKKVMSLSMWFPNPPLLCLLFYFGLGKGLGKINGIYTWSKYKLKKQNLYKV